MGIRWPLRPAVLCFAFALMATTVAVVLSATAPFDESPQTDKSQSDDGAVAPSSHDDNAGAPRLAPPANTHPDEATVREILEIRREQGGILDGTLLDELSRAQPGDPTDATAAERWQEAEFARALRGATAPASVAGGQTSPQPEISKVAPSPSALTDLHPHPRQDLAPGKSDEPVDDVELARALRYASRQLDRKANDLEEVQRYSDADQLRVLSERLRQESRRWVQTRSPSQGPLETPLVPVPAE